MQEFGKLLPSHMLLTLNRDELDVRDEKQVLSQLESRDFDAVVNLAAFHNVNECEKNPEEAFAVNALGARNVACAAAKLNKKAVFVSTDYVFGGENGRDRPYHEFDAPSPLNVYGITSWPESSSFVGL